MNKSIVVMGGSFNPPTIAHLKIMQKALDSVNAERGFLVPVSFPYLKRKMVKAGQSHLCLSDELRLSLLDKMIAGDERIQIYTDAMGEPFSDDAGNMRLIQEKYPAAEIYYVSGDDKLDLLDNFARKTDFFERFRCILYARESDRLMEQIASHEYLAPYKDVFILVSPPEGIEGISSTKIREHLFDIESVADMLHPGAVQLLRRLKPEDYPEEILQFKDEYAFLSNDFPAEVAYEGIAYPCAASAFLASKTEDPSERKSVSSMNPEKARQKYNARAGTPEWEDRKADIMEDIIRLKFQQHPDLMERLTATGNQKIINGSKKDKFWGVNLITWEGKNHLGRILMKVRTEKKTK